MGQGETTEGPCSERSTLGELGKLIFHPKAALRRHSNRLWLALFVIFVLQTHPMMSSQMTCQPPAQDRSLHAPWPLSAPFTTLKQSALTSSLCVIAQLPVGWNHRNWDCFSHHYIPSTNYRLINNKLKVLFTNIIV